MYFFWLGQPTASWYLLLATLFHAILRCSKTDFIVSSTCCAKLFILLPMIYVACSHLLYAFYVLIYICIYHSTYIEGDFLFPLLVLWFISRLKSSRFKAWFTLISSLFPFCLISFFFYIFLLIIVGSRLARKMILRARINFIFSSWRFSSGPGSLLLT